MSGPLLVLLQHGAWADRYQATTFAITAAAMGEKVVVALFFEPLRLWAEGRFDEGALPTATVARVASLRETLEEARRELGLEVVACDTAVRLVGLDPAALAGVVDRIVTLPQLWAEARDGRQILV
jgi:peroxiredoxin family protein